MLRMKPLGADLLLDRANDHLANPHRPYPNNLTSNHFLVMLHGAPDGFKGRLSHLFGQPSLLHKTPNPFDYLITTQTHMTSQVCLLYQPNPNCFTMDQPTIATK